VHLGRKYYSLTLWANSALAQKKWMESILKQQDAMRARSRIFERVVLSEGFFAAGGPSIPGASSASVLNGGGGVGGGYGLGGGRVNCAAPYGGGRRVVYGTDEGVYISELNPVGLEEGQKAKDPVKVLELQDVTQVDVLEDYQLLIVLSGKLLSFPSLGRYGATDKTYRKTCHHIPPRGFRPTRSVGWFAEGKTDCKSYQLFQGWILSWKSTCMHRQVQSTFEHVQDARAH
jgi:hypothetical protein